MGDIMSDVDALQELYKVVSMGIIGLDEVKGHISDKVLAKTMIDAKKKYSTNKMDITKMLEKLGEEPQDVNTFVKMFNEIYTGIELVNCNDEKIAKMLIEGTNKGIIIVEQVLNSKLGKDVLKLAKELLELLEFQINNWKPYL